MPQARHTEPEDARRSADASLAVFVGEPRPHPAARGSSWPSDPDAPRVARSGRHTPAPGSADMRRNSLDTGSLPAFHIAVTGTGTKPLFRQNGTASPRPRPGTRSSDLIRGLWPLASGEPGDLGQRAGCSGSLLQPVATSRPYASRLREPPPAGVVAHRGSVTDPSSPYRPVARCRIRPI